MKIFGLFGSLALALGTASAMASPDHDGLSGQYLEVRSCDVYTGPCFANGEMGLTGKEGILVWSIRQGAWQGTALDGLSVIAVVRADGTMGDLRYEPRKGKAVVIVDEKANREQRRALAEFARSMAGSLAQDLVTVQAAPIQSDLGNCTEAGCSKVKAGDLLEVSTRCLGNKDHVCGNESAFYPPLTTVAKGMPAYTERAAYKGNKLGLTWDSGSARSAYLASFSK